MPAETLRLIDTRQHLDVTNADLSASFFVNVKLAGATFDEINLSNATITNVNLSHLRITDRRTLHLVKSDPCHQRQGLPRRSGTRGYRELGYLSLS